MTYTCFPAKPGNSVFSNTYLELVCAADETRLVLKSNSTGDQVIESYLMTPHELFRPDEDAHFTSRNGRQWRPE